MTSLGMIISLTFCESRPSASGLTEDSGASDAEDDGLGVAEDGGDLVAPGALHVHEVRVGVLDQALQLVLALLILGARVQQVNGELESRGQRSNQMFKDTSKETRLN